MQPWDLKPAHDLGLPLQQRLRSPRREIGLIETGFHVAWWGLVWNYLKYFHRLKVHGLEHLPTQPPFVMVGNHESHMDALIMAAPFPWRLRDRVFPIAAGDTFFEAPMLAMFAVGMVNALPIWRKKAGPHGLKELRQRLVEEPCGYILFPEGTRSRDGKIGTFKAGLGMLLGGTNVPVIPCHIEGAFEALPPNRRWPKTHPITLSIGPALSFGDVANTREGWLHIAQTCESAVRGLSTDRADERSNQ